MEKRKWLWKRKSSERSPGETESSGSISSHSERYSDDQEALKASPNHNAQSPEVTSKAVANGEDINDSIRSLTEKLSAALVNVSAKEDLVKQHAKVAEEAIAGWEKAENEVVVLKQKLEAAVQQNTTLEARVSHLDGALKECVRQLRQAREEQEKKIHEAVEKETREWESMKLEFESQLLELQSKAEVVIDPDLCLKLEFLEKENSALKTELLSQSEELEIRAIERDLSAQAAETASKQHLESIKKVAKLEAECRRLKAMAYKSSPINDHKSVTASSICVESLIDSQSDSGERLNAVEIDTHKMGGSELNKCEPSCSDSWASALIAELDQFKNEKAVNRNLNASSIEIDLMDDFLEMERLAAMPNNGSRSRVEPVAGVKQSTDSEVSLRAELEAMVHQTAKLEEIIEEMKAEKGQLQDIMEKMKAEKGELEQIIEDMRAERGEVEEIMEEMKAEKGELEQIIEDMRAERGEVEEIMEEMKAEKGELEESMEKVKAEKAKLEEKIEKMEAEKAELEEKIEKTEAEKAELEMALTKSQDSGEASEIQLREAKVKLEELQRELNLANESKQLVDSKFISMEVEVQTMSAKIESLEDDVEKERALSAQITIKCQKLEEELWRAKQEVELEQIAKSNGEVKIKQEDLDVASGKLAECQKTIASLGKQLKSLATLEDFLIDTASIPEFPKGGPSVTNASGEPRKLHSNETFSPKRDLHSPSIERTGPSTTKNDGNTPPSVSSSTSSAVASNHVTSEKNRNGFAKFFSRTKNGIQLEL